MPRVRLCIMRALFSPLFTVDCTPLLAYLFPIDARNRTRCQVWQVALLRQRAKQRMEHRALTHALFEAPKAAMLRMGHPIDADRADKRRRGRRRCEHAGQSAGGQCCGRLGHSRRQRGDRSTWVSANASLFSPLQTPAKPPRSQLGTPAGGPLRRPVSRL